MKYTILVMSTQREYLYVNITGNTNIDYFNLWLKASEKRYVKMHGFYIDISEADYQQLKKKESYKKFFDSLDDFLKY